MDFWISDWISGFQIGFLDFTVDFWISQWISGFHSGFLDFSLDFWISVGISADGVRDFFRDGPLVFSTPRLTIRMCHYPSIPQSFWCMHDGSSA